MRCTVCGEENKDLIVRNINIYTSGSEGTDMCHGCEMLLVEYVRGLRTVVGRAKMAGVKIGRRER